VSAMAEGDRFRIVACVREGSVIAREKGVKVGRKHSMMPHQQREARRRVAVGENRREVAKAMTDVSRNTIAWL
jgi:hypothetical protein